jgi:hypothetical protein
MQEVIFERADASQGGKRQSTKKKRGRYGHASYTFWVYTAY